MKYKSNFILSIIYYLLSLYYEQKTYFSYEAFMPTRYFLSLFWLRFAFKRRRKIASLTFSLIL